MKRVAKPEGKFNVVLEDAPVPAVGPHDVRVRNVRSLISRGSELWRRYIRPEAVDPQIMGYSVAGVVDAVGAEVDRVRTRATGWGCSGRTRSSWCRTAGLPRCPRVRRSCASRTRWTSSRRRSGR